MYITRSAEAVSLGNKIEFNPFSSKNAEPDSPELIVRDAFEAATNGMHNPEAMQRLENLDGGADVGYWKLLIRAIENFYKQDFGKVASLLTEINDESMPGRLKAVLLFMSGLQDFQQQPSYHEEKLIKRVTEDSRFFASAVSQLNDSMEYGGQLFTETASLLIKEIKVLNFEAAERLALWALNICLQNDFDEEPLADNIMMIFGQAEGLRLIALSLMEVDPESSVVCFIRSLINRLSDKLISRNETEAWLDIIAALLPVCEQHESLVADISELLSMLDTEIELLFGLEPHKSDGDLPEQRIRMMKDRLSGTAAAEAASGDTAAAGAGTADEPEVFNITPLIGKKTPVKGGQKKRKQTKKPASAKSAEAVQLELF